MIAVRSDFHNTAGEERGGDASFSVLSAAKYCEYTYNLIYYLVIKIKVSH